MRSTRHKITNLINKLNEVLAEGKDVYGYAGINKSMLIQSLRDSYALLACLEEYNATFEVVFMKRSVAELVDWCYGYLKNSQEINSDSFNSFLKTLNKIRAEIKTTYILVSQSPLRLDSEIAESKELLDSLKTDLSEISEIKDEIIETRDTGKSLVESLETENTKAEENNTNLSILINQFEVAANKIETTSENVAEWEENIESCQTSITENKEKSLALLGELEKTKELYAKHQSDIDSLIEIQKTVTSTNETHQKEIKATLEGASKHGLAGSFYTRKRELGWIQLLWGVGTVGSIILLMFISYQLIKPIIEKPELFNVYTYLARLPIFGALVWLGWFCTKQFGYISRIREEYSFKYAIAMAFEGYKKESLEVNEQLLENLLKLTLNSVATSPASHFETKNNHGTPANEVSEEIIKKIEPMITELIKKGISTL